MQSEEELRALEVRNFIWRDKIKDHVYPLSHGDIADYIGMSRVHVCNLLNGKAWLTPELYRKFIDIDLRVYFHADGPTAVRAERKLRKVISDAALAKIALAKYF